MPKKPQKGKVAFGDNLYQIKGSYWLIFTYRRKTFRQRIGRVSEVPLTTARRIALRLKAEIIEGKDPSRPDPPIFREAAQKYLEWYISSRPHVSKKTIEETKRRVKILVQRFGEKRLDQFADFTVESYKIERISEGVKPSTVNRELNILRAILRKAVEFNLYNGDLPRFKSYRVNDERTRYLSREEFERLMKVLPPWLKAPVIFAIYTGLRPGELFTLRWENVNLQEGYITVQAKYSKTKETKHLPLHPRALEILEKLERDRKEKGHDSEFIFVNSKGKPYSPQGYRSAFKTALKRARIENFRFYDLRHTFASHLVMKGVDLYTVAELMRHSSPRMTKRYAHLSPEHLRKELKKLEL